MPNRQRKKQTTFSVKLNVLVLLLTRMVFSTNFLAKCSVYIAVGGMTSVMIMRSILKDKVRRQEYFQSALKITRNHEGMRLRSKLESVFEFYFLEGAKLILGEPIKEVGIDLGEPNVYKSDQAYVEVSVKGSQNRGTLYFWADKPEGVEQWNVSRIELQLKDDDKRLLIKKPEIKQE